VSRERITGRFFHWEDQRRNELLLVLVLVFVLVRKISRTRTRTRTKSKKAFISGKTGNEGIQRVPPKTDRRAGSILLFAEKCPEIVRG